MTSETPARLFTSEMQAMFERVAARYDHANRIMTLGMDRRWRRMIPTATVTVTLPPASLMFLNRAVNDGFSAENWGTWAPNLIWLFWAVGLGVATYCYWLRRRGPCQHCERTDGRTDHVPMTERIDKAGTRDSTSRAVDDVVAGRRAATAVDGGVE